jgi:stage V sporulation protein R
VALLYEDSEWDFDKLRRVTDAVEEIAVGEMGLDVYPNRIEVITSEQMLDAYSAHGLPLMYPHWSFGKRFAAHERSYSAGYSALAYEIVLNTNPCIVYIMEENTMTMQTLVIAHAAFGHNHFFKNNSYFRQWTNAEGIMDYLAFARKFVLDCQEKHGLSAVERILDAAHALSGQGIDRYTRRKVRKGEMEKKKEDRKRHEEETWNLLWTTLPRKEETPPDEMERRLREAKSSLNLPDENLLYFVEKNGPKLEGWERELIRIVRKIAQYFYPQMMDKVANEGCATFAHLEILRKMNDRGQISDGHFMEAIASHCSVITQPNFDDPRHSGWNPYALGFAIMNDVKRMCLDPTREDKDWFPSFAGNGDPYGTLRGIWADYRDDGLIRQCLSPKVIRDFRMFQIRDDAAEETYLVKEIHDEEGYRNLRNALADSYDPTNDDPVVNVTDLDLMGSRRLELTHTVNRGRRLNPGQGKKVMEALHLLWGYPVTMIEKDAITDKEIGRISAGF